MLPNNSMFRQSVNVKHLNPNNYDPGIFKELIERSQSGWNSLKLKIITILGNTIIKEYQKNNKVNDIIKISNIYNYCHYTVCT